MISPNPTIDHKRGISIATIGGLLLACDIPLVRLAGTDPWTTMVIRGPIIAFLFFLAAAILSKQEGNDAKFYQGKPTLIFGALHGTATICFVNGIFYTTTANLVFITAFASLIALVIATVFLKQKQSRSTWIAVFFALGGVVLITLDDFGTHGTKHLFGNFIALICALLLACEMLYARQCGKNLVFAPGFGAMIAAFFALPFVLLNGITLETPSYLFFNAMVVTPLAGALLALAPRYIPGPEAAMFFLLETAVAPLLVWAIFAETPTGNTLLGGLVIISAILVHSYGQIKRQRRMAAI